eukprot:3174103-Amphidinium_carterae.1
MQFLLLPVFGPFAELSVVDHIPYLPSSTGIGVLLAQLVMPESPFLIFALHFSPALAVGLWIGVVCMP